MTLFCFWAVLVASIAKNGNNILENYCGLYCGSYSE